MVDPGRISLTFTPGLAAEHKDLCFTLQFIAPTIGRTYSPMEIIIRCNSAPGGVESSLDAALDAGGTAFAAFRLPSQPTDDDLSRVEIACWRADGTGAGETVTLDADVCVFVPEAFVRKRQRPS